MKEYSIRIDREYAEIKSNNIRKAKLTFREAEGDKAYNRQRNYTDDYIDS